jgi:hypothetical protein
MWRGVGVCAGLIGLLAVPTAASASGTSAASQRVISGTAVVSSCGSLSGISVAWNSTGGVVTSVAVSSIPSSCVGGTLSLTLAGATGTSLATVSPVTITATTQTLALVGAPTASGVSVAAMSVVGP